MRGVKGLLGKTEKDGGSDDDPLSRLIPHLNQAFKKPAQDDRLIFIDINGEPAKSRTALVRPGGLIVRSNDWSNTSRRSCRKARKRMSS